MKQSSQGLQNWLVYTMVEVSWNILGEYLTLSWRIEEGKEGGEDREKLFTTEIIAELKINESEPDGKNRGESRN